MGVMEEENPSTPLPQPYALLPSRYSSEDILFCIDIGAESFPEMKNTGPNGRPVTRLDSILKSIGLFVNAKLSINGDHGFGFVVIGKSVSWIKKEFSSEVDSAIAAIGSLPADSSSDQVDLTELFHIASQEAKRSREQGRILRVVSWNFDLFADHTSLYVMVDDFKLLWPMRGSFFSFCWSRSFQFKKIQRNFDVPFSHIQGITDAAKCKPIACDGSIFLSISHRIIHKMITVEYSDLVILQIVLPPKYQLPANRKLYTLDVVYLHDKPGPENCPQKVYDALVDAIEHISEHDGYIFETSQGLQRILVKNMCLLLSYPPQRCIQDDLDVPRNLAKKPPVVSPMQGDDSVMIVAPPNSDS
ncbi:hypothetical protein AKJ16_DCAP15994 [Drosera capensis]